ncbi:beta-microseminoprotein-like [Discoglossus pictus]
MMKCILAFLFTTAIVVSVCNAACYEVAPDLNKPEGCLMEGVYHPPRSSWRTKSCLDCSCSNHGGMHCCSVIFRPVYDKKKCVAVFNRKECKITVLQKKDRSKECEEYMMIG